VCNPHVAVLCNGSAELTLALACVEPPGEEAPDKVLGGSKVHEFRSTNSVRACFCIVRKADSNL
jgi:hypothetical protein